MQILSLHEINPVVRIANYHPVSVGQAWLHRTIPDVQVIFFVEGFFSYEEVCEKDRLEQYTLSPGEVLLIEPGRVHSLRYLGSDQEGVITGAHMEFVPQGSWLMNDYRLVLSPKRVTQVADPAYLHQRFKRLAQLYSSYLPYRELHTSAIVREIALILAGYWQQSSSPVLSDRMQKMLAYLRANLRQPLSRQTLAQTFNLSPEHINLLFRKELGMPPSDVINRERVMAAYRLLNEQGFSVKEAAYAVGYSDPFYFSRVFRRVFGHPPSRVAMREG